MTPEDKARLKIDALLEAAGWIIQDKDALNLGAGLGVIVRHFQLGKDEADYVMFIDRKAAGVIEAKAEGITLSGVAEQSDKYMGALPDHIPKWADNLLFDYESTGVETNFKDMRDPKPRSRRLFAFHTPETLHEWLRSETSLRTKLTQMPELNQPGLRDCQIDAITGLEKSLAEDRPKSLIQMATGAGKTFTACSFSWRLLKHANAKRILFLVDRSNLGTQTLKEFQNFDPPGANQKFTDIYVTQQLKSANIDKDAKVVITTIQRLYSMLKGKDLEEENEEKSAFEVWESKGGEIEPLDYNPDLPIESFDFIVADECHRSIYGLWRQVLDYFDAHLIGLTATPTKHTLGFFQQNLVAEYPYERSVADKVNVGYEIFRIRTEVGEKGALIDAGYHVPIMDKRSRKKRYEALDADLEYQAQQLDRSVTSKAQIRTVLQCYKDNLFTELFPGRTGDWIPKTLIFAKDDNHAEEIVMAAREVFGEGNDFAKKITYKVSGEKPADRIKGFRVDKNPRIAVTVDMIATGTDIKPVEAIIFMRDVKSEGYYEQMKGRGVRTIDDSELAKVTPDARTKTRFVLVDAVGVTEGKKNVSQPLERQRHLGFEKLIEQIAQGRRDEDGLTSLAGRLAKLEQQIGKEDAARIQETAGISLREMANALLDTVDADLIEAEAKAEFGPHASVEQEAEIASRKREEACRVFDDPTVRKLLVDIKSRADIVIDDINPDMVIQAEFDVQKSEETISSFKQFLADNRDEITALQILYDQPLGQQRLTYAQIKDLTTKLSDPPQYLTTATVWQAYKRVQEAQVRGAPADRLLTEVIALVRFALGQKEFLEPISADVTRRFNLWLGRQKQAGITYSDDQLAWLTRIKDHIAANAEISARDMMDMAEFTDNGGLVKARELFGSELNGLLDDLTSALVA